ncbi:hypothetical protein V1478_003286 [Vespula squamosa]|uniref:Uncharacterized protein n=1 Tax=Vespula squamosa TaxID=30214 RepID=A0ABD2BSB7_VESSQ
MSVSRILTDNEETCTEQTKANQVQRKKINIIFDDRIIALQQACINDLQSMIHLSIERGLDEWKSYRKRIYSENIFLDLQYLLIIYCLDMQYFLVIQHRY